MLAILQQHWPIAAAAVLLAAAFLPKDLLAKLKSLAPAKPATEQPPQPAVKASDETDPATLCEQAGSIWRQRGEVELANKAFLLATDSAKKGGGA